MQFLWKYIDDILGKGIGFFEIMELLGYFAVTLIPLSIPITILISSVMVFGDMAERYEMTSFKSAGVSLIRIMRGGIVISILTALFSLLASNYLAPKANYEYITRRKAIQKQKASLVIEEGVFDDDFRGYVMRVQKKHPDGRNIEGVKVYDHSANDKSLINLTVADNGEMFVTDDGDYFVMHLKNGEQYKELRRESKSKKNEKKYPFTRTKFEEWTKYFDMSQFDLNMSSSSHRRNKHDLMTGFQLREGIDSLRHLISLEESSNWERYIRVYEGEQLNAIPERKERPEKKEILNKKQAQEKKDASIASIKKKLAESDKLAEDLRKNRIKKLIKPRTVRKKELPPLGERTSFLESIDSSQLYNVMASALTSAVSVKDKLHSSKNVSKNLRYKKENFAFKLHQQFSMAIICILFLFLGGPLGSVVRKGGYGFPLLSAIVFYMIFMMLTIMSQKMLLTHTINPILLAWIPCLVIAPISILISYMALKDRKLSLPSIRIFSKKKRTI